MQWAQVQYLVNKTKICWFLKLLQLVAKQSLFFHFSVLNSVCNLNQATPKQS